MNRHTYVQRLLNLGRRHGAIPSYGSPEWEALESTDPRVFAATVIAAENWYLDGTDEAIAQRLRQELEQGQRVAQQMIFETGHDIKQETQR